MKMPLIWCLIPMIAIIGACGDSDFKSNEQEAVASQLHPGESAKAPTKEKTSVKTVENVTKDVVMEEATVESSPDQQDKGKVEVPADECVEKVLTFDEDPAGNPIQPGALITDQYAQWDVTISAVNAKHKRLDKAITFDSANPTGDDDDLMTPGDGPGNEDPLYNLLIIAEDDEDHNEDGLVDNPDDNSAGGKLIFEFARPTEIRSIDLIDIEEDDSRLKIFKENGDEIENEIPAEGDNSVQTYRWDNKPKVNKLKVILDGSGAVDNLTICQFEEGEGEDDGKNTGDSGKDSGKK
jgi:hypothetical protein